MDYRSTDNPNNSGPCPLLHKWVGGYEMYTAPNTCIDK